jgi:[ribosomal protein S5]-alanine N-acetyltransferase
MDMQVLHPRQSWLEPLCAAHAAEMYPILGEPAVYEFLIDKPPASLEELTERYRRLEARCSPDGSQQWLNWIIRLLNGGACAGFVQATLFTPRTGDFAFVLGPAYWGRGLAYDACIAALQILFRNYGVTSLFATVDRRNARSLSLLGRLGFRQVERAAYPHGDVLTSDHVLRKDSFSTVR